MTPSKINMDTDVINVQSEKTSDMCAIRICVRSSFHSSFFSTGLQLYYSLDPEK